ncbi:geranyl transferase [Denitratisoma sp. DHT3]|uniref:polyprenyl synthetase family protein n=1 Tax=Denitratisoma sp. DHT3 TaxID=1981880 RepID=UPI0011989E0D|nr:farnesyl diphosphate synthase [Denitratisoma sp. DHT3]QDX80848.1 geranyl transferase [Denitratisoma sp. DHT3]
MDFSAWMSAVQQRTESALERLLPAASLEPARLHEAMRYSTLGGGKRVRPLLCHGAGEIAGAAPDLLDAAACAVEMIHVYSLVHDDMPCMDDDVLRRGKPTCHVEFDEATALLVGDALQSLAFQTLAEAALPAPRLADMLRLLAHAAGSRGMAGGQAIDLAATGRALSLEELEFMHIHKTGALIRAAVLLGARCGNADEAAQQGLTQFANRVGLLFQVVDDILDAEASTATLGKTAGKDAANNKPTYVSLLGIVQAKQKAAELRAEAHHHLSPFGDRARRLHELTDYIVERTF